MISEERSNVSHISKQALNFPVGLLIRSPKKSLAKLGRKPSNGSLQSNTSDGTTHSAESTGVRQPAKNKIRRHNNRLSTVFNRSPLLWGDSGQGHAPGGRSMAGDLQAADDPAELSSQMSAPGILKIFGSDICQGTNYKSVLATTRSSAKELVKEALERYCLEKEDPSQYVLCDVIGQTGADHQWKTECFRVVGDHEKPLMLQSLWKPKEGFSRRFEIQKRVSVEEQSAKDTDTVTAGINAQARKLQKGRSRVTSLFMDGSGEDVEGLGMWRSLSEMDLSAMEKEAMRAQQKAQLIREDPEAEADKEALRLGMEKEETESSDDNTTQYSIHPPFDFPYFLLLQGYSYRQASWSSLRTEFMPLNPAQLHHMLREYKPGRACPADWNPSADEAEAALRTTDILESFDNHPPLILPSNTFHLELGKPIMEPALFEQLGRLQDFIRRLPTSQTTQQALSGTATDAKSATSPSVTVVVPNPVPCPSLRAEVDSESLAAPPKARGSHGDLSCCLAEAELTHKLKSLERQNALPGSGQADLGCHKSLALDPSCLLTPPNTPQGMELSQSELEADLQEGAAWQHRKAGSCPRECSERRNGNVEEDNVEEEEVFTVELHRGPHGLGLALVDGMKTPLKMTGIYIKSVVPESPAAQCQKLRLGDRILAVNGISLVGMEYHIGRELIRSSGDALRLLVAKIESKSIGKSSVIKC
ncbi:hypothetical protein J4Q44_G00176420 [Coregonus suidteri]|uniref:Ras-associating and dilute domain-containing protein n=1 Tax=Coregonus suidteri TaxID=861788 RepID=A0AAN8LJF2_9TELE